MSIINEYELKKNKKGLLERKERDFVLQNKENN